MASNGSLRPQRPPHITVNSGSGGNILDSLGSSPSEIPGTPGMSRQLLPSAPSRSSAINQSSRIPQVYGSLSPAASAEMLLPPPVSRAARPYRDAPTDSRSASAMSSRRTSFSSDAGDRDSRYGPFASPFDDSRSPSRAGSDDDPINTQTVAEKYNIMPSPGLLIFPEDVETDDYLHNPDPNESDREKCNIFNVRGMANLGGLFFIAAAVLVLFVGYPILQASRSVIHHPKPNGCDTDPTCLSDTFPLLKNQRVGLIDPDTPKSAYTKTSNDGTELKLVFSDEFNTDGRTFYDGDDPYFQAVDLWYGVTEDLEWYDPDAISTANGTLNIKFDAFQNHNLNYRSGMLQSWNKMCFKGGRLEASVSLPGSGEVSGFWPGFWAMGNLGRPGYASTTDGLWPYSYEDKCDAGITANQSSLDGISYLPGMRYPACTCEGQDHPSAGKSRSAPEIDGIEASVGFMGPGYAGGTGSASQSFQAAPFDIWYMPDYDYIEVYDLAVTSMNSYKGGPYQQAISGLSWLNDDWYDGKAYQTYGFEYTPGATGDISWFVGDNYTWKIDHRALRPNGNIGQRVMPAEPMSVVVNFGMSPSFADIMLPNLVKLIPATMRVDYIRIYQESGSESVTCDPPGYPTTDFIANHAKAYNNPNLTTWEDTGYTWPTNTLVDDCT